MITAAKENVGNYDNIEYKVLDIQEIPYEDETFDAVIANMMLYHVPDIYTGLAEVRRVLKRDGSFYCATYENMELSSIFLRYLLHMALKII